MKKIIIKIIIIIKNVLNVDNNDLYFLFFNLYSYLYIINMNIIYYYYFILKYNTFNKIYNKSKIKSDIHNDTYKCTNYYIN